MTLRAVQREGYCDRALRHFYTFNVDNLIASAGADYVVPDILPGAVCRQCGGDLECKLAMTPPAWMRSSHVTKAKSQLLLTITIKRGSGHCFQYLAMVTSSAMPFICMAPSPASAMTGRSG